MKDKHNSHISSQKDESKNIEQIKVPEAFYKEVLNKYKLSLKGEEGDNDINHPDFNTLFKQWLSGEIRKLTRHIETTKISVVITIVLSFLMYIFLLEPIVNKYFPISIEVKSKLSLIFFTCLVFYILVIVVKEVILKEEDLNLYKLIKNNLK